MLWRPVLALGLPPTDFLLIPVADLMASCAMEVLEVVFALMFLPLP